MHKFPLAVIGAGVIGRTHIERILKTPEFTLVGVAEPGAAGRQWCAERNVPTFENHQALLQATQPQGVVIATPNATHVDVAADCMARGIAVLVEKPVADTLAAAQRLIQIEQSTGVPVLVGHHRRHNPILQRARQIMAEGRLGQVLSANVMANVYKPEAYFDVAWRRQAGGGPVLINLIHDIDMLVYLLGEVRAVQGSLSSAVRGLDVEDTGAALLEFAGGTQAVMTVSDTSVSPWCWDLCAGEQSQYPRQHVQSHFFSGTQGSLSLPDLALWRYPGERHWHREMTREQSSPHEIDVYVQQLRHFRAVAERRETPICSALDGWRTLQATLALLQAAHSGQRQTCPAFTASRNPT
ncbi:Gfo/Idh/MocA family protein [Limnohabitans sp. DCL3]|uniref:Gfo/Idh/MocA family protein n=1 Tax=Limnohabitans sp. DCL3 TaxID=3374103 RepID=UPI003A87F428